jgi:hypothetical protein
MMTGTLGVMFAPRIHLQSILHRNFGRFNYNYSMAYQNVTWSRLPKVSLAAKDAEEKAPET